MTHRTSWRNRVAPEARRPYRPGLYSVAYQELNAPLRRKLDGFIDTVFVTKTGVRRKLDERSHADRVLVRQWLLIRDAVMAWYQYNKILSDDNARGLHQRIEARIAWEHKRDQAAAAARDAQRERSQLQESVKRGGLPEQLHASTIFSVFQVSHVAVNFVELIELAGLVPHALHAAAESVGFAAMPLAVVAGLMEVGEAREAGDREAERNAFRLGFASQLVYGRVINALPSESILGRRQVFGQKAASRLLDSMRPDVRASFLDVYRGQQKSAGENLDRALHDVGAH